MSLEATLKNMALFGLMMFAMFSFMFVLQEDNPIDGVTKLRDDPLLNDTYNNLNLELNALQGEAETQRGAFEQESPSSNFGELTFLTIVSVGKVFNGLVIGLYNILIKLPATALGVPPIIYSLVGSLLVITLIIGSWLLYRANPKQ